jgi:hypothetical protein
VRAIQDFHLLANENYALVRGSEGTAGVSVRILERRANETAVAYRLCSTGPNTAAVAQAGGAYLFSPARPRGDTLVVHLHQGRRESDWQFPGFVGHEGEWMTDVLLAAGYPVVAVNYTGSDDRPATLPEGKNLAQTFATEIADAVRFAEKTLGRQSRLVIVAEGMGTVPAFAALASGSVRADGLIVLAGVTEPNPVLGWEAADASFPALLAGARAELSEAFVPGRLYRELPNLKALFLHGVSDLHSFDEMSDFVARNNAPSPRYKARMEPVTGAAYGPGTREQVEELIGKIIPFIAEL